MNDQDGKGNLSRLINSENVFFIDEALPKEKAIRFLVSRLHKRVAASVTEKYLLEKIFEVEKLNNVLETGFYIPHAKLSEINDFHCALALLRKGFKDPEGKITVKACFMLLTPNKAGFFQKHLNILSTLSQMFTSEFIDKMIGLGDPGKVAKLIAR